MPMKTLFCFLLCLPLLATETAKHISSTTEVEKIWQVDQHLYVKGEIGLKKKQLDQLEIWLDKNAPNWTVVLVDNTTNELWRAQNGVGYRNLDAAEYSLGQGVSNQNSFIALTDKRTNQRNGAIFFLSLQDRTFSYFGSEVANTRGLGKTNWKGNLDSKAKQAMRNGGRIAVAVTDTINSIEGKITRQIETEQAAQKKLETRRLSLQNQAPILHKQLIHQLDQQQLKLEKITVLSSNNTPFGFNLSNLRLKLKATSTPVELKKIEAKWRKYITLKTTIDKQDKIIAKWHQDPPKFIKLEQNIIAIIFTPGFNFYSTSTLLNNLELAKSLHQTAQLNYIDQYNHAQSEYANALRKHEIHVLKTQQQHDLLAQQERNTNALIVTGTSTGTILFAGLGIYGNRRRKKSKEYAEAQYQFWREEVKTRRDLLFKAMDHTTLVVGSEDELNERNFHGRTRELSLEAMQSIDQAFIITSGIEKSLDQVKKLLFRGSSRIINLVSSSRYEKALHLLDRETILHSEDKLLIKVDNRDGKHLLRKNINRTSELSFKEHVADFDNELEKATRLTTKVEDAWSHIYDRLQSAESGIEHIEQQQSKLSNLALKDGLFKLSPIFDTWLAQIEQDFDHTSEIAKSDPVIVIDEHLPGIDRTIEEVTKSCTLVTNFRKIVEPRIKEISTLLTQHRFQTKWIDRQKSQLSQQIATSLSTANIDRSVIDEINGFDTQLDSFYKSVISAGKYCIRIVESIPENQYDLEKEVSTVRDRLSRSLAISSSNIMSESVDLNPDNHFLDLKQLLKSSRISLNLGSLDAVDSDLRRMEEHLDQVGHLIEDTTSAFDAYQSLYSKCDYLLSDAARDRDQLVSTLSEMEADYAPTALLDEGCELSMTNLISTIQALVSEMNSGYQVSPVEFKRGRILDGYGKLQFIEKSKFYIAACLISVTEKKEELVTIETANKNNYKLASQKLSHQVKQQKDHHVVQDTLQRISNAEDKTHSIKSLVFATGHQNNPYSTEQSLEQLDQYLSEIDSLIGINKRCFYTAKQSYQRVLSLSADNQTLANQSSGDAITDSDAIIEAIRISKGLHPLLERSQQQLKQPHFDWFKILNSLSDVEAQYLIQNKTLSHEIQMAQEALSVIRRSRSVVDRARSWSGRYGVSTSGDCGDQLQDHAYNELNAGNYQSAINFSGRATAKARSAVSSAESEVRRIKRRKDEEDRRRRAAARARARRQQSSLISSSSSSSRSSFSSGSGMGRSGW